MGKDFLTNLLERSWAGELQPGQFKDELGWHVAGLAGEIQDLDTRCASVIAQIGLDPRLARPGDEYTARALVDTFCELTVRPLKAERDVCTDRLIIDQAFQVNRENPRLAAALFALANL